MNARIVEHDKRISQITIMGAQYPLNFSLKAVRKICVRYGDIDEMLQQIDTLPVNQQLGEILWILQLFLEQGALYHKIETGEQLRIFTLEELEVLFSVSDSDMLYAAFIDTIRNGSGQTVEVEQDTEKNMKATQG